MPLSVMTRSTVTPWAANQAMARRRNPTQVGARLVVEDLDVGEAAGVVDGDVADSQPGLRPRCVGSPPGADERAGRAG